MFAKILRLFVLRIKFSEEEKRILLKIQTKIEDYFCLEIDFLQIVKKNLLYRKGEMPFYRALLKKIKPKRVILVVSYGKETLIELCKEIGITVIELQHGVLNSMHVGYSFPRRNQQKRTFPDYFLTWGDYWKESTNLPIPKERVFSTGYPFFEEQALTNTEKINKKKIKQQQQILFLSQGSIGRKLSKIAVELSEKHTPYRIIYKTHPEEFSRWKKDYPWLYKSNVEVIDNKKGVSLYQLFAQSQVQVGVYSTAIYEGLYFGLRTYIVNLPGVEYMDYLIQNRYATMVCSAEEISKQLNDNNQFRKINPEYFFKNDSIKNIINKLESGNLYIKRDSSCQDNKV